MEKKLVEGKFYYAKVGDVRQAFADGFGDGVVGIDINTFQNPTYWYGRAMNPVDDEVALAAIANGFELNETIQDILFFGAEDEDICYVIIA